MNSKERKKLDNYYMSKYGITWAQRMDMWKLQKGRCAICGKHERRFKKRLAVDHCHRSGKTRSLLCFPCNRFLVGRLTLQKAKMVYLYLVMHEDPVHKP